MNARARCGALDGRWDLAVDRARSHSDPNARPAWPKLRIQAPPTQSARVRARRGEWKAQLPPACSPCERRWPLRWHPARPPRTVATQLAVSCALFDAGASPRAAAVSAEGCTLSGAGPRRRRGPLRSEVSGSATGPLVPSCQTHRRSPPRPPPPGDGLAAAARESREQRCLAPPPASSGDQSRAAASARASNQPVAGGINCECLPQ